MQPNNRQPSEYDSRPNDLDFAAIRAALAGTIFHDGLHHFPTIGSTNTHALAEARKGAAHGSFYLADEQTAGRGRSNHPWHSAASQGLYVSALIRPAIAPSELVWIPLLTGLAAHRAILQVTALAVDLRWPNDLLIGPRKTAGILVEAQANSTSVSAVVAGIGINLHQRSFPPDLATEPTSLDLETGRETSRQALLIALLQALDAEYRALASPASLAMIPARIAAISSWVEGRRVAVHGPQPCEGVTAGLDVRGFLRVLTAQGVVTITTGGLRDA
ncbi:MAG TPA: biotin--[acetyl-CoA-carboxylase] ligase [Acidobacteriaceae bacterium]|nr:biotin--[acetyl-CoA-carboxylase] ligase [Acidobacteriaceae bacterium]